MFFLVGVARVGSLLFWTGLWWPVYTARLAAELWRPWPVPAREGERISRSARLAREAAPHPSERLLAEVFPNGVEL